MGASSRERGHVLVTGGAGFIGSHLVDGLLAAGYGVRILDSLLPQVHPGGPPAYLNREAELQVGDLRDDATIAKALEGIDIVVHFAAAVGVGQSMYEVKHYCSVNVLGTASLLEAIVKGPRPGRLIVASSMSIYGEGLYRCPACGPQSPVPRPATQLERREWAMKCPSCGGALEAVGTPETKPLAPTSVYAVNKRDQEEMVLSLGRSLGIPALALRFFNVYGDRQALSNPYTGVAAIFSSCLLNGRRPLVFEDGLQVRDFVHISDVVQGCLLAIERSGVADLALNVGTGQPVSVLDLLTHLQRAIPGAERLEPEVLGRFREGDVRACYADISLARRVLGFEPRVTLQDGIRSLAAWVELSFDLAATEALGPALKARALQRLAPRLVNGVITVTASEFRSQLRNRDAAQARLARLLHEAVAPPPKRRRPTRPGRGVTERRLAAKRHRSEIKRLRRGDL